MLSLLLGVLLVIAVVFLRIVCKLRLVVPLLLAIAFQTILRPWYQAHIALGTAFFLPLSMSSRRHLFSDAGITFFFDP